MIYRRPSSPAGARLAIAGATLALAACAGGMSREACLTADWRALGEEDGATGAAPDRFETRAKACQSHGAAPDAAAYDAGRALGLARYCTPQSAFNEGAAGRKYRGVCPADLEPAFLAEFDFGARLHKLSDEYTRAVASYDDALKSIDSHRYDLRRARNRYDENTLPDDERAKLRDAIKFHRQEIERLEREIPLLDDEVDETYRRLEDYRAFLARRVRPQG